VSHPCRILRVEPDGRGALGAAQRQTLVFTRIGSLRADAKQSRSGKASKIYPRRGLGCLLGRARTRCLGLLAPRAFHDERIKNVKLTKSDAQNRRLVDFG
jgi:hypothetical protein